DLTTRYGGVSIAHPFGKASGQLSCTLAQVEGDIQAGLAFVVLKTVVAEDSAGGRSMAEWSVRDTKMQVESRISATGRDGWTVTWTGRGWHGTLADYLEFFDQALALAGDSNTPIVPSVKYHLPVRGEPFREAEYEHTTTQLIEVWNRAGRGSDLILEKDFSPTLAGDQRSGDLSAVLRWLERVPGLIVSAGRGSVQLGVKVMNGMAGDEFQIAMLKTLMEAEPVPAFLIVFNRLFDAAKRVAFGGWDLSNRNLRVLDMARQRGLWLPPPSPPLSATGNICSGRMMLEYALRGCENGQVHTLFQLPRSEYTATGGNRSAAALHTLLLHPSEGLVPWLWHLHESGSLEEVDGLLQFHNVIGLGHA
ncbi:MAG: hypothetical protein O7F70_11135, partial [Gemmatimonadetes bacterium]|nr:hypothetical protein [Gemmatimonadota bacterium]